MATACFTAAFLFFGFEVPIVFFFVYELINSETFARKALGVLDLDNGIDILTV